MPVTVAEYLGQRVAIGGNAVTKVPLDRENPSACPFRTGICDKIKRGQQPICSVRDTRGTLWLVCQYRLCAPSPKDSPLNEHQKDTLLKIGRNIFDPSIAKANVIVKREVPIRVTGDSNYKADFVMWRRDNPTAGPTNNNSAVILEMQGGGETTGTAEITEVVKKWAGAATQANAKLLLPANAAPLPTNAWRRQQEQFLVKGNVAMLTGARMVFCVGSLLFDYLIQRLTTTNLVDLTSSNWTLALLTFEEDTSAGALSSASAPDAIPLKLSAEKRLFTNYASFVQALTNQGAALPDVFTGDYVNLNNVAVSISL